MSNDLAILAARGRLPELYQAAQRSLAECERIDECKDIADKAMALASYAKQANDESLHKHADRIKARAVRRCGELSQETEPNKGGSKTHRSTRTVGGTSTRTSVATTAGLSKRQKDTALRVAAVPEEEFERSSASAILVMAALASAASPS